MNEYAIASFLNRRLEQNAQDAPAFCAKRYLFRMFVLICGIGAVASANLPPVVIAGNDTTLRLGRGMRLKPTVSDDVLHIDSLTYLWTQVSGPDSGIIIGAPDARGPQLHAAAIGAYTIRLTVSDGQLSSSDDMVVTVLDSIPFLVLEPAVNERIPVGTTYRIAWQIDPPGTDVLVYLSTDNGSNYEILTVNGRIQDPFFDWFISEDTPLSDACIIYIANYADKSIRTYSGVFALVNPNNASRGRFSARPINPKLEIMEFGPDGRIRKSALLGAQSANAFSVTITKPIERDSHAVPRLSIGRSRKHGI